MSDRDGFGSGFWLGTVVGGVVGGIVGASIASQRANRLDNDPESSRLASSNSQKRPLKSSRNRTMERMEIARRSLDDKISDLNQAIDSVRSSIGHAPGDPDLQSRDKATERLDADIITSPPSDAQS
ncbi:hypothetical protein [Chamaesiphon sp.]|uniref:hypothetical protein n=1 Tax=Chamaesiphon sp. TaxID=2814140 RepID=UPI003593521D